MNTLRTNSPIAITVEGEKEGAERIVRGYIPIYCSTCLSWWDRSSDAALLPYVYNSLMVPQFMASFLQLLLVSWNLLTQRSNHGFRGHSINGGGLGGMGISKTTPTQICAQSNNLAISSYFS